MKYHIKQHTRDINYSAFSRVEQAPHISMNNPVCAL